MAKNPLPSLLDHQQILQRSFDDDNDSLRVGATVQVDTINADLTVDIKASSGDNIAITRPDGTNPLLPNADGSINIGAISIPLPANAALEAGGHLASIDSKLNSLGQKVMSASVPIVIASDQSAILANPSDYAIRLDTTSTANVTYAGYAIPGSITSSAIWRIKKIDETTGTIITWADGNNSFDNIWDNRTGLTYV